MSKSGREFFRLGAESYSSFGSVGKREENSVSTFGRFRLWTCFESSPVSVKVFRYKPTIDQHKLVSKSVSQTIITNNYIVRIYLLGI